MDMLSSFGGDKHEFCLVVIDFKHVRNYLFLKIIIIEFVIKQYCIEIYLHVNISIKAKQNYSCLLCCVHQIVLHFNMYDFSMIYAHDS